MRVSEERKQELMARIRQVLVRKPSVGSAELAKIIGVEQNYALKLMKKVRLENVEKINRQIMEEEVGKLEMEVEELVLNLWEIVSKTKKTILVEKTPVEIDVSDYERINAIKAILEAKKTLFNIKFDSGIFSRQLGTLKTENRTITLDLILENVKPELRQQFDEILIKLLPDKRAGDKESSL